MQYLKVHSSHLVKVDDEDFERLNKHKWHVEKRGSGLLYVFTRMDNKIISLHRFILKNPHNPIDHINGDGLDNRKSNLRICSHAENMMNRKIHKNNNSGFKGVYFDSPKKKYRAKIRFHSKFYHIGYYSSAIEAARAYDTVARNFFKEFARPNL